jgi:phosphatidylglycerophosphate synthase
MLDRYIVPLIKPAVDCCARGLVRMGAKADHVTLLAFGLGLIAAIFIANRAYLLGASCILLSRLCDALDGAVARQTEATDAGGFLDISLDFLFYASVPLAFAVAHPAVNALPAATLLAAFMGTASSFLAFAALAAKRGMTSIDHPHKSLYFLGGLTESAETLAFFLAICVWPNQFASLAYLFSALCCVTIATRIYGGWRTLRSQ